MVKESGLDMDKVQLETYEKDIEGWRREREERLRREDGWLTLAGLYWLQEGENSVGSDPATHIVLPIDGAPDSVGIIDFHDGKAVLRVTSNEPVLIDDTPAITAVLRDDAAQDGPSLVKIGTITFFVIKRGDQYGVRVRDANSPERQSFTGRKWFDINVDYRLRVKFIPYDTERTVSVVNTVGLLTPMDNPGYVEFSLHCQEVRLEAFSEDDGELWFIFKDATSGKSTYGAGRYLIATLADDDSVDLDFNKTYNPPCVFTKYATCPLPPKENVLPIAIEAGEKV
jgi:uncharacterized protein (DUF1684 family)